MKNKKKLIKDFINHLLILLFMGFVLIWLIRNRYALNNLGPISVVKHLLWAAIALFLFVLFDTIRGFSSSYMFQRFDPADPTSLKELSRIKRYQVFPGKRDVDGETVLLNFLKIAEKSGYTEVARQTFGIVFEKDKGSRAERFIVIYKPMLNVIIADRHIKEASEYILRSKKKMRRNAILLISDMDSNSEMLSSAVCAVNFVPKLSYKTIFVPYVLDLVHGRLFYPQDYSGINVMDGLYYKEQRNDIIDTTLHTRAS